MPKLIVTDPYITHNLQGFQTAHQYVVKLANDEPGSISCITFKSLNALDDSEIVMEIDCAPGYAKEIQQGIRDIAFGIMMLEMGQTIIVNLARKFSSPALTSEFREHILHSVTG